MIKEFELENGKHHFAVEEDADNADGDTCMPCMDDDNDGSDDEDITTPRVWTRKRRPKPFTLLPIAKLRRSNAYYGMTELEMMFSRLRAENPKRKRDDETNPWNVKLDPLQFGSQIFNFSKIKGKKYANDPMADPNDRKWYLCCFRTNGVTASLTFVSGSTNVIGSPNVAELIKKGYQVPPPKEKVDMNTKRGLFRVTQTRNDLANDMQLLPTDEVVAIDPGFVRPIQMGSMNANTLMQSSALEIANKATQTSLSKQEWMQESGRHYQGEVETKRRLQNKAYGNALDSLAQTRRRCAESKTFSCFAKEAMSTLTDRNSELMHKKRCLFRWRCEKRLQGFLARVADTAFDRTSSRLKRRVNYALLDEVERNDLRDKLWQRRKEKRECNNRRIVFFGDGQFLCTMRGNPSIPKKKLLKLMAVRGLTVLIDEYNTSKMCPCGCAELCDLSKTTAIDRSLTNGKRVRVHKTDGGDCNVLKQVDDRDELATIQQLLASGRAMAHKEWPSHLLRPPK